MASRVLSDLASIRCPVRILVPREDAWSDPAVSRKLAEAIARGKAVELPDASHQCLTGKAGETMAEYCLSLHRRICQKEEEHA